MTRTSTAEQAILRSGGDTLKRYLSVVPRLAVFADTITGLVKDSDRGSVIALDHAASWSGSGVQPGMTVDLGTTPGGRDVGSVRLRYLNSTDTRMTIAETSLGAFPMAVGQYVTVRNEYRPWRIQSRLVPVRDGDGNIIDFTEYQDYYTTTQVIEDISVPV